jgi:hypothetical protein
MTTPHSTSKKFTRKGIKPLAIATLLSAGILQPLLPVMAATTAGQGISNTATATYEDEEGNDFTSVSNTVEITVAEVAGIQAEPIGVDDANGGSIEGTDQLRFKFKVTNVGNDSTDIRIPAPGNLLSQNFNPTEIRVYEPGVTPDFTTDNSIGQITGSTSQLYQGNLGGRKLLAGESITVVVIGNISGTGLSAGDDISVTLGNTPPNDNSLNTQNQPISGTAAQNLRTEDLPDPATPSAPTTSEDNSVGAPVEEREASAYQYVDFATQQKPLAFATVKKTDSNVDPGATGSASDDVITYDLSLTVENTSPSGAYIPADLATTKINFEGNSNTDAILVSDAIPNGTVLSSTPIAPSGWTVVYSTSALNTSPVVDPDGVATAAEWTDLAPTDLSTVKRVGFMRTTRLTADGTEIDGFQIKVVAANMPATGGNIYNLAQVFGKTYNDPSNPNNPVDQIIYDESGDSNPNNFENGDAPDVNGDETGSEFSPNTDTGVANVSMGTDDGSNTGIGPDGEANLVVLTGDADVGNDNILNGPNGEPGAVGPTDDDDDYTNAGIKVGNSGFTTGTPEFTNTVQNPANSTSRIDNVTVQPISPSQAEAADDNATTGQYGVNSDIPTGTRVRIANIGNTKYAIYEYDGSNWDLEISSETYESSPGVTAYRPLNLGTLNVGAQINYTVDVFLPGTVAALKDVAIPMIAFPDTNLDGYVNESVNNITIDRVYNGFMKLTKQSRIFDTEGTLIENWTDDPQAEVETGYVIEYRVIYENITPTLQGSGNKSLSATNFKVVEDGDKTPNNWFPSATTHASGTSASAGIVTYYQDYTDATTNVSIGQTDPADDAEVEAYVNTVGTVGPGEDGTFIIRRKVQ